MDATPKPRPRVLVVEDDPGFRRLMERMIVRQGCACVSCADGREAVHYVETYPCDLVFVDLHIPKLDGFMVACELRRLGYCLPLVAMSALTLEGIDSKARAVGFDHFLNKPVEETTIQHLVSDLLRHQKLHP